MNRHAAVFLVLVGGLMLGQHAFAQDKSEDLLAKSLKEADLVFTGKIGKVNPLGQTSSIPPSTFGNITFKEPKALRGALPQAMTFSYSFREGRKNFDLEATGQVIVAVKQKGVLVIVPATEANLALARKPIEAPRDK
jgi:hypothetical protein